VHTTLEAPQTKQTILKPGILGVEKSTIGRKQLRLKAKPAPRGPALLALWFLCCERNNSSLPLFLKRCLNVSLKELQQPFPSELKYLFPHLAAQTDDLPAVHPAPHIGRGLSTGFHYLAAQKSAHDANADTDL
jgi:hypothetical protein